MYYLTGGVTDKPTGNGGYYSVSVFNNDLLVGTYISTDNFVFAVKLISGTWTYTQLAKESEIDALNGRIPDVKVWTAGDWRNAGGNAPFTYGAIIRLSGNYDPSMYVTPTNHSDTYFLAVPFNVNYIMRGASVNNAQDVTWISIGE